MKTLKITDTATKKTSELMAELRDKFNVWSYWDDTELDNNSPSPKESTTREFPIEQESSDKNKSWNDLTREYGDRLMTLREYILAFIQYHKETGEYLDKVGWTIFRDKHPDGCVAHGHGGPRVGYRQAYFGCSTPDVVDPRGGGRVTISLNSSSLVPSAIEARVEALEEFQKKVENMLILD